MKSILVLVILLALAGPALAVDGVLEINQTCAVQTGCFAGDTAGFPVVIPQPGSYQLTGNLTVPDANTTAIDIDADEVTLNLNGFSIRGPTSCSLSNCTGTGTGVGVAAFSRANVTITNGTVRGMGSAGVSAGTQGARVKEVKAFSNGGPGIQTGSESTVTGCTTILNGGLGISAGSSSVVSWNTGRGNGIETGGNGIFVGSNSSVVGNASRSNKNAGFRTGSDAVVSQNSASNNDGPGFSLGVGSKYRGNSSAGNGAPDDCGGGICSERRRYYVTKTNHDGAQAPTACATGFHMASLWEILDPSHLAYDTILGGTAPDSGEGPPSAGGGGNFFGWIRTGTSSHGFGGPGSQNCKAYTSNVGGDLGTLIWPSQFWNNSPANPTVENLGFWLAFDGTCSAARKVWCVEDE